MSIRRDPPWLTGASKIDSAEVQSAIMDLLMERGALTTAQLVRDFKKRWGATPIMHALKRLQEARYIQRATNRDPWRISKASGDPECLL